MIDQLRLPVLLATLFLSSTSGACSCPSNLRSEQQIVDAMLQDGRLVFVGKVVATGMPTIKLAQRTFRFEVQENFKGKNNGSVLVSTPLTSAECGTTVALGKTYLVVAYGSERAPIIQSCDRPEEVEFVAARIALLRDKRRSP